MKSTAKKSNVAKSLPLFGVVLSVFAPMHMTAQTLFFERVFDETLAQTSYVVGSKETNEVIVIDPKRDIDTYLDIAKKNGLKIAKVAETHIHADYLSGAPELTTATGAELLLSGETDENWKYEIPHTPLKDGDRIKIGNIVLEAMHTPGHTPESLTFLLTDLTVSTKPQKAFTGDFVFVGDVGRPDLLEKVAGQAGSQDMGAKQLHASIQRFSQLPEELEIWPGHGAGSFCGKSLSDLPKSTLGEEKLTNAAFQFQDDEDRFVKYILEGQPEPPKYFAVMKNLNRIPRPLYIEIPKTVRLSKEEFATAQENGVVVVDTRKPNVTANGHLPGSLHIEGNKSFSTFMGWVLDYQKQFILIAEEDRIEDLTRKLTRIGMDNIYGYVSDMSALGQDLKKSDVVDVQAFKAYLGNNDTQIIDVRSETEYQAGHIPGVENIAFPDLEDNLSKISRNKTVIVHCKSGIRANMAYSILKRNGIDNVKVYLGAMDELIENN